MFTITFIDRWTGIVYEMDGLTIHEYNAIIKQHDYSSNRWIVKA